MNAVIVRAGREADRAAAVAIAFEGMRAFGVEPDPEGIDRDVARFGEGGPRKLAELVAERDGEILGCIVAVRHGEIGKITGFYVRPEARGAGVGAALLAAAVERCRTRGVRRLALETWEKMAAAVRLYERTGWVRGPDVDPAHGADRSYSLDLD